MSNKENFKVCRRCAKAQRKMHSLGIDTAEDALIDFAFAMEHVLEHYFNDDSFTKREVLELVNEFCKNFRS